MRKCNIGVMCLICVSIYMYVYFRGFNITSSANITTSANAAKSLGSQKILSSPTNIIHESDNEGKPLFIVGILSRYSDKRDTIRKTWLTHIQNTSFRIIYKFVLDQPTHESEAEMMVHHDIFYLHHNISGYAKCFDIKILIWFRYVQEKFPQFTLVAKMDDDVFLCMPQIFERIYQVRSSKLYYGFRHMDDRLKRIDEMFVIVGKELVRRILKRKHCGCPISAAAADACNKRHSPDELITNNYAGMAVALWLSFYDDVDLISDNSRMTNYGKGVENDIQLRKYAVPNYCDMGLLFHKSTDHLMHMLHHYNIYFRGSNIIPQKKKLVRFSPDAPHTSERFRKAFLGGK